MNTTQRIDRLERAAFAAALARFRRHADAQDRRAALVAHFGTATPDDAVFARWQAGLSAQGRDMVARMDAGLPALWDERRSPAAVRDALAVLAPIVELPPAAAPLAVLVRLDALLYGGSS